MKDPSLEELLARIQSIYAKGSSCSDHTDRPNTYREWIAWRMEKEKTHEVKRCQECGRYLIWEPKPARVVEN